MECAHPDLPGYAGQGQVFVGIRPDVLPGARDLRRFGILLLQQDLIGQRAELVGEELEQPDRRLVFARLNDWGFVIQLHRLPPIHIEVQGFDLVKDPIDLLRLRRLEENLARLEVGDNLFANFHAHRGLIEPELATQRAGHAIDSIADLLLHSQAGGARVVLP